MRELLLVAARDDWPTDLDLRPFTLSRMATLNSNALRSSIEAVILVPGAAHTPAVTAQNVASVRRDGDIALLLAGSARSQPLHATLAEHPFDGVLDLDWPQALVCAAIETAVRNVKVGRNIVEIQRTILEQTRTETASLYELAVHDDLTQLFNHRHFAELMAREHERSRRRNLPYALVFIDLDNLKTFNTQYGYASGSKALSELAQVLTASLRSSDAALRIGGDEFVLFLSGCNKASAGGLATRLFERLRERPFLSGDVSLSITVSAGVAAFPEDGAQYPELLARADQALRWAKANGRNQAVLWSPDLAARSDQGRRAP